MESFLSSVAKRILAAHPDSFDDVTIVFNNRRAGLFLSKEIEKLKTAQLSASGSPITYIMPRIIGIDDLIAELGGLQIVPNEFLLFELFDIHRGLKEAEVGRRFESFEEFIPFGELLLSDFSEIDLYLVDANQILKNLREVKQMGEWNVSGEALTPFQERYITFYNSLIHYYTQLHDRLLQNKQAYAGMAYRNVAEHIDSMIDKQYHNQLAAARQGAKSPHIWFVGFNALSNCETTIMDRYVRRGLGSVIFDGDEYYLKDSNQEAGHFLRHLVNKFPDNNEFINHFSSEEKVITIINCPENILQAKEAGQILSNLFSKSQATDSKEVVNGNSNSDSNDNKGNNDSSDTEGPLLSTALVLADEGMLIPVLNSLPAAIRNANVTMGFPFIHTNIHILASNILKLYLQGKGKRYHHTELTTVLCDNLIAKSLDWTDAPITLSRQISNDKMVYANADYIVTLLTKLPNGKELNFLFPTDKEEELNADDALLILKTTVQFIAQHKALDDNPKEYEALACLTQLLNYLSDLQQTYHCMDNISTLERIYSRLAQRRSVAFYGEPLNGLQILGMLETRSLDFDRVILLSVNEGVLPTGRSNNTLIPLFLKRRFGIPTFEEKDAVYANHFYRLLQKANEIYLIYSSEAEATGKGEPSRFLLQVCNELAERYSNIHIHQKVVYADNGEPAQRASSKAFKDAKMRQRLQEMAASGFSPTRLNHYRSCPFYFYYQDVIGLNKEDELKDDLENSELGTCIHKILQDIYKAAAPVVDAAQLQKSLTDIDTTVDSYFKEELLKGRIESGKNHTYNRIAKLQISRFLEQEIQRVTEGTRIEIKLLEEDLVHTVQLKTTKGVCSVNVKGQADRIDLVDGQLRIGDYKSGSVSENELIVNEDDPDVMTVPDKWFQVMTYAWLYCRVHHLQKPFTAGIFPLRSLGADFMPVSWNNRQLLTPTDIDRFETLLVELLTDIVNPDGLGSNAFTPSPRNANTCRYCPFVIICKKETN